MGRADALRPGHRLHVYTVADVLGAGGFGITYRAAEQFTERLVAIKEYLPNVFAMRAADGVGVRPISEAAQENFNWGLDRFRREAKTLYDLRHPGIVPVLQYFEENGTGYLVMEYQSGATLGALLKPGRPLAPALLGEILEPILDGLAATHSKGFLHRDIKPDNIFIRDDDRPLLLDFGAARQATGALSQTLTAIISEGYAPIEQYESTGKQGPFTDIYALGATLYRCMTGEKPVPSPARIMAHVRGAEDPLPPLGPARRTTYGAALVDAVEAALKVNAPDRPQSIAEFRARMAGSPGPGPKPAPLSPTAQTVAETLVAEPQHTVAETLATPMRQMPAGPRATMPPPNAAPESGEAPVKIAAGAAPGRRIVWASSIVLTVAAVAALATVAADSGGSMGYAIVAAEIFLHVPFVIGAIARRAWARTTLGVLSLFHALTTAVAFLVAVQWSGGSVAGARAAAAAILAASLAAAFVLGIVLLATDRRARREARAARPPTPAGRPRRGRWFFIGGCITAGCSALIGVGAALDSSFERERAALLWIIGIWVVLAVPFIAVTARGYRWGAIMAGAILALPLISTPLIVGFYAQESRRHSQELARPSNQQDYARQWEIETRRQVAIAGTIAVLCIGAFGLALWFSLDIRAWQTDARRAAAGDPKSAADQAKALKVPL